MTQGRLTKDQGMKTFNVGDRVRWNSEAGKVTGRIIKKVISDIRWKGYIHHASRSEPQYVIKSDKSDHLAIHKASALRLVRMPKKGKTHRRLTS